MWVSVLTSLFTFWLGLFCGSSLLVLLLFGGELLCDQSFALFLAHLGFGSLVFLLRWFSLLLGLSCSLGLSLSHRLLDLFGWCFLLFGRCLLLLSFDDRFRLSFDFFFGFSFRFSRFSLNRGIFFWRPLRWLLALRGNSLRLCSLHFFLAGLCLGDLLWNCLFDFL